jgi:hypothetical protein
MNYIKLDENELKNHVVGEPLTVTAVMTIVLAAVMAVVVYRLFMSQEGGVTIPGGWKFTWE